MSIDQLLRHVAAPPDPPDITSAAADAGLLDVAYITEDTPVGRLLLAVTPQGLVRIAYLDAPGDEEAVLEGLADRVSPRILTAPRRLDEPRRELDEYFAGRRSEFEVPIDWQLMRGFGKRILEITAAIPFGSVSTYGKVAAEAGSPRAARAAGNALGANPMPIVVPCHRVLHANGGLGGYTGGLDRKRTLLAIEGRG
jgi:methylated-DNA-[protein]-cysteine S-methyltransferase